MRLSLRIVSEWYPSNIGPVKSPLNVDRQHVVKVRRCTENGEAPVLAARDDGRAHGMKLRSSGRGDYLSSTFLYPAGSSNIESGTGASLMLLYSVSVLYAPSRCILITTLSFFDSQ
jgi:hypothetical protein